MFCTRKELAGFICGIHGKDAASDPFSCQEIGKAFGKRCAKWGRI